MLQTWVSRGSFAKPAIEPLAQPSLGSPPNDPLHAWPADVRLAILLNHRHQPSRSGLAGHTCCGSPRPGRAHEQAAWLGKPWHMRPAWPGRRAARAIARVPSQTWAACVASRRTAGHTAGPPRPGWARERAAWPGKPRPAGLARLRRTRRASRAVACVAGPAWAS